MIYCYIKRNCFTTRKLLKQLSKRLPKAEISISPWLAVPHCLAIKILARKVDAPTIENFIG